MEDVLGLGVLRTVVSTNTEVSWPGYPVCVSQLPVSTALVAGSEN